HRRQRAGVLPVSAVGAAARHARRHGGSRGVREGARRARLGHPRHGRAVAGPPVRGAVHPGRPRDPVLARTEVLMHVSHDLGVWVGALLTLFIFSFLFRDNPLYKFAEHLFVGVSAGYNIVLNYWTVIDSNLIQPLGQALHGTGSHPE